MTTPSRVHIVSTSAPLSSRWVRRDIEQSQCLAQQKADEYRIAGLWVCVTTCECVDWDIQPPATYEPKEPPTTYEPKETAETIKPEDRARLRKIEAAARKWAAEEFLDGLETEATRNLLRALDNNQS